MWAMMTEYTQVLVLWFGQPYKNSLGLQDRKYWEIKQCYRKKDKFSSASFKFALLRHFQTEISSRKFRSSNIRAGLAHRFEGDGGEAMARLWLRMEPVYIGKHMDWRVDFASIWSIHIKYNSKCNVWLKLCRDGSQFYSITLKHVSQTTYVWFNALDQVRWFLSI